VLYIEVNVTLLNIDSEFE